MELNERQFGTGCVPDEKDERDYVYEHAFGAPQISDEEWAKGFDSEKALGVQLKIENQNGSSSCVGQAVSKIFEIKFAEKGQLNDFSAKWIYANVTLGAGNGASLRDGIKWGADNGCALESVLPSYENGKPPTEEFMIREEDITDAIKSAAKHYDKFEYRVVKGQDIDSIAVAIRDHKGVLLGMSGNNESWRGGIIDCVGTVMWGHAVIATQFGKDERGKWIGGLNSWSKDWGLNGYWKCYEDSNYFKYPGAYLFNPWVLVWDKKEDMNDKIIIAKDANSPAFYVMFRADSPDELKAAGAFVHKPIPVKSDGSVDWELAKEKTVVIS